MYLGHLPGSESDSASEAESLSATVEAAHHDLLNKVLDDGRSSSLFTSSLMIIWHFRKIMLGFCLPGQLKFVDFSIEKKQSLCVNLCVCPLQPCFGQDPP